MKIKLFKEDIKLPEKSHLPDVGLDCFIPESFEIKPFETKTIKLGFGGSIPEGFAGMLVPRSSTAMKGLIMQTQVIDPDYTGEYHLIVTNCSIDTINIERNQRICSLVVYSVLNTRIELTDDLGNTDRGTNGLGSTGK